MQKLLVQKKTTLRHFFAKFEQLTIKRPDHF